MDNEDKVILLPFIVVIVAAIVLISIVFIWPYIYDTAFQYSIKFGIDWQQDILGFIAYLIDRLV